jgi:hypothetical protein
MRFQRKAVPAVAFLIATTMATGCVGLNRAIRPQWRKCERVSSQPRIASLWIFGEGAWRHLEEWEAGGSPPGARHPVLSGRGLTTIDIFEKGGIRVMDLTRSGMIQNPFRCEQLSAQALASAIDAFENLASGLSAEKRPFGDKGELLQLQRAREDDWKWGAVDELSPEELEAVRSVVCLADETLGQWAERAVRAVGPELTTRLGFPATCAVSQEESRTNRGLTP